MPNSQGENMRNLFDLWCIGFFRISNPLHLGSGLQIPNSGRLRFVMPKAMKHLFPSKKRSFICGISEICGRKKEEEQKYSGYMVEIQGNEHLRLRVDFWDEL
jgi:hypothetical protein